jgi:hypothetical protein
MELNNDINFRLIANHGNLKKQKIVYKNNYLKYYIESKFKCDTETINNLINYIEKIVNDINLDNFIIEETLKDIIKKIEDASIY